MFPIMYKELESQVISFTVAGGEPVIRSTTKEVGKGGIVVASVADNERVIDEVVYIEIDR